MGLRLLARGGRLAAVLALAALVDGDAIAQRPGRPLLNRPLLQRPLIQQGLQQLTQPQLQLDLVAGEPFGVGRMLVPLPGAETNADIEALAPVVDRGGRVVYPAYEVAPIRQIIRDTLNAPQRATVFFLFRGAAPLEFTSPIQQAGAPRVDPAAHARLLADWWRSFAENDARLLAEPDTGPSDVRDYLTWMLARRLHAPNPRVADPPDYGSASSALAVLTGADSMRRRVFREALAGGGQAPANLPLPAFPGATPPPAAPGVGTGLPTTGLPTTGLPTTGLPTSGPADATVPPPPAPAAGAIEPIAEHVPAECLYVRFGNFANFLWFRQRLDSVKGQLQNFAFERGLDSDENRRLEDQLCSHQSSMAQTFGPQVVADVAFLGLDTFGREGGALGILLQAKNNFLLRHDFGNQRAETLRQNPDCKDEPIQIGAITASFVHTPDNRIRSIYIQDGDFHLLTTSRTLAERFVEAGQGKGSLAAAADFAQARATMPVERDFTAFVFLSEAFQRNLLSPHYQVEMIRRWRSAAEIEIVQLAQLAARGEGAPADSPADLIAGGYLPPGFGQRGDGSRLEWVDGRWIDSLRGRVGTFLPAPDTPVNGCDGVEARRLADLYAAYQRSYERFDPVMVGVQRAQGQTPEIERVIVDARSASLAEKHYQFLSQWLGPPLEQRFAPAPGDQIAAQVSVRATPLGTPDHVLFAALRDSDPAYAPPGIGGMLTQNLDFRGYVGAWPVPGLLGLIPGSGAPPDPLGYSSVMFVGWRRVFGQYTLMSLQRELLEQVAPQLHFEPATQPAQLWLRTADLGQAKLSATINRWGYRRAVSVSRGNAQFINSLIVQMRVPPELALPTAERLIGARFVDPLGGQYELRSGPSGLATWVSTKAPGPAQGAGPAPPDYTLPALKWLRGVSLEALLQPDYLMAHAEIEMPALEKVAGVPMLSLPSLPFTIPGWGK